MQLSNFGRGATINGGDALGESGVQIFVSYTWSKDETGTVDKFARQFEAQLKCWIPDAKVFRDKRDLPKKGKLEDRLQKALNDSDVLLILVSPEWLASEWCRWEFNKFFGRQIKRDKSPRIVPLLWLKPTPLELTSKDEIVRKLAAIKLDDLSGTGFDETWCKSVIVRIIAKIAEQVVKSIDLKERRMAAGPDVLRGTKPNNKAEVVKSRDR